MPSFFIIVVPSTSNLNLASSSVPVKNESHSLPPDVHLGLQFESYEGIHVSFNPPGDGNCQFAAILDQLHLNGLSDSTKNSTDIRQDVVNFMEINSDNYSAFHDMASWSNYVAHMRRTNTYGDHLTLHAASRLYKVKIIVLYSTCERKCILVSGMDSNSMDNVNVNKGSDIANNNAKEVKTDSDQILVLGYYPEGEGEHYVSLKPKSVEYLTTITSHVVGLSLSEITCKSHCNRSVGSKTNNNITNVTVSNLVEDESGQHRHQLGTAKTDSQSHAIQPQPQQNHDNDAISAVEQFVPDSKFPFPVKKYGKKGIKRCCRSEWFKIWPWLTYVTEKNCVLCIACVKANKAKLVTEHKELSFVEHGFSNWKKATNSFKDHEKSASHREACLKWANLKQIPVSAQLNSQIANKQRSNRRVLDVIFSTIKFLGRQGLPL